MKYLHAVARRVTKTPTWVFALFAASRLFFMVMGVVLAGVLPVGSFHHHSHDDPFGSLNLWAHFDGDHYIAIAQHGYGRITGPHEPLPGLANPAFFPLYPLLIRAAAELLGGPITPPALSLLAVIISLAALPFGLWFVYAIAEDELGAEAARATTLLLAFFPMAFFFNAAYTESLFLVLSAGAIWAARVRRDLLVGCTLAGFATATRNVGLFLLIPLALEWWEVRRQWGWRVVYLALVPGGLIAYATYLWLRFGHPSRFLSSQGGFHRGLHGLVRPVAEASELAWTKLGALVHALGAGNGHLYAALNQVEKISNWVFFVCGAAALVLAAVKLRPQLTLYALALFLIGIFFAKTGDPLLSLPRFMIVDFPLFMGVAAAVTSRWAIGLLTLLSVALSIPLVLLFVNWYFVA